MLSGYALIGTSDLWEPGSGRVAVTCGTEQDKRQMRGAWLTTVGNID